MKSKIEELLVRYFRMVADDTAQSLDEARQKEASPEDRAALEEVYGRIDPSKAGGTPVVPLYNRARAYRWLAGVAAAVVIAAGAAWWLGGERTREEPLAHDEPQPAEFTGRQMVYLPDGSTAILNDASTLRYEASYGNGSREITLSGEAYFNVQSDPARPFIVHTGKVKTTVLGTAFNVRAYKGHEEIIVTVTRGKVAVSDDRHEYSQILPNEQLAINTLTDDFEKTTVNTETTLDWKSRFLILDNVTMEEAARIIGDHFGVTVSITNPALKKCAVTGTFLNDESLQHIVAVLSNMAGAEYSMSKGNVKIEGGSCN